MPVDIRVRLPGTKDFAVVSIETEKSAREAIEVITKQLGTGNLAHTQLVIAPTEKKNGCIISPLMKITELKFNPNEVKRRRRRRKEKKKTFLLN